MTIKVKVRVRKPKLGPHSKGEGVFHNLEASHFEPQDFSEESKFEDDSFYRDHILECHPLD
jgi:hypothetical protein